MDAERAGVARELGLACRQGRVANTAATALQWVEGEAELLQYDEPTIASPQVQDLVRLLGYRFDEDVRDEFVAGWELR